MYNGYGSQRENIFSSIHEFFIKNHQNRIQKAILALKNPDISSSSSVD